MSNRPRATSYVEVDVVTLLSGLIRKLRFLIVFICIVAAVTFFALDRIEPIYQSHATILVQVGESAATLTAGSDGGRTDAILDQEAIASHVQFIQSGDLAKRVSRNLHLASRAEFNPALAQPSMVDTWLARSGLANDEDDTTVEERVLKAYYAKLATHALGKSGVIGIDFWSTDPELAANAANAIAEGYVAIQRTAKRETATDVRIISRAAPSSKPAFPKKVQMTAMTTVAALILGIAIILLRELASGWPVRRVGFHRASPTVSGIVPVDHQARSMDDRSARRIMPCEPTLVPALVDRVEESVAAIAGEIDDGDAKRILVTLAEGCEENGRPLAAVALARVLARTEARVVVVDLRSDDANTISMGEAGGDLPGFTQLLDGKASFAQVIFRDRGSRVHFIPAGRSPPTPEVLDDERVETVLSALTLTYDYVILDVPDDMIAVAGPGSDVAVVVSQYGAADPRTESALDRVEAVTDATIQLLVVDSTREEAGADALGVLEPAWGKATTDEAA